MLFCCGFYSGDLRDTERLLGFINDLGGCAGHDCLLIADKDVDWKDALALKELAEPSFKSVKIICDGEHAAGWIPAGNSKFKAAALYAQENNFAFYFNEPDAIPLKHGWLDAIENEYKTCGKAFMGALVSHQTPNLPNPYLEGNSVYPANAWEIIKEEFKLKDESNPAASWVFCTKSVLPLAADTKLTQSLWGEINNPPIFASKCVPYTNVFCLEKLNPDAVVFHRSKGGSLIRLLQRERGISKPIVIVFPVCHMDIALAIHHAKWLNMMDKVFPFKAYIAFDPTINLPALTQFKALISRCFEEVELFQYPVPPIIAWPNAPNWAWQHTAKRMAQQDRAWLWFEADAVALTPDWLERIDDEYQGCGRSWMGPVVEHLGHMNGVGIYPSDAACRMPIAMHCTDRAWDYDCKPEMIHDCHDASALMQHLWLIQNGQVVGSGFGEVPSNFTADMARKYIPKGAAITHRIKDFSLLNLLMSGQYKP